MGPSLFLNRKNSFHRVCVCVCPFCRGMLCVCYVSCDIHLSLLLLLFLSLSALLFSIVKDCPEEWQRGMSAGLLDPMKPMDTIFVKYVRENGPAVKAGLSTGIYIIRLLNF